MSEFEDPELQRLLTRAGGANPDVNVAYERMKGRVLHVRRRRAVVTSGLACALVFATAFVAINRSDDPGRIRVGDSGTVDKSLPDDSVDTSVSVAKTDTANTTNNTTNNTTDTTDNSDTTDGSSPSSDPPNPPPTTAGSSPVTTVFTGEGGSITVRLQNGSLTLVSYNATAGFSVDVQHSGGDRVEVRFESPSHQTQIRVDIENGAMNPSIEEVDEAEGVEVEEDN